MNRLAWTAAVVALGLAGELTGTAITGGTVAFAQTAGGAATTLPPVPAGIPAEARTGSAPESFRPQIIAFIKGHSARLQSGDTRATTSSRDALVSEVTGLTATAAYEDVYTTAIVGEVNALLASPKALVRLQGAVLAARVAAAVDNTQLAPVALKLLADPSPAMVVYGFKTARAVIAYQVQSTGGLAGSPLPAAVTKVAVENAEKGDYNRDAVDALYLDLDKINKLAGPAKTAAIKELVPHALKLLDARAKLYSKGLPEDPESDRIALTFFSNNAFAVLDVKQRQEVLQRYVDILLYTTQASTNADTVAYRALATHSIQVGRGIYIIASTLDKTSTPETKALVKTADFFRTASDTLPPASPQLTAAATATYTALTKLPEFAKLTAPVK